MKVKECIQKIIGRSIFDSRGIPTVEVDLNTVIGRVRASCPSGASTGSQEALEIRDAEKSVCMGKGVQKALMGVEEIATSLITKSFKITCQEEIDKHMNELDGTPNKSRLGANAILPMSICFVRLGARYLRIEDWMYIRMLMNNQPSESKKEAPENEVLHLPTGGVLVNNMQADSRLGSVESALAGPGSTEKERLRKKLKASTPQIFFNVINGGAHSDNGLFVQEVMVSFEGSTPYTMLSSASEFIAALKSIVKQKYKLTGVGDEGGFAPPINSLEEALDLIQSASQESGVTPQIALDVAASEFYKNNMYNVGWKTTEKLIGADELAEYYEKIIKKYKVCMIEDPFDEKDYAGWAAFMKRADSLGVRVVGDDLIVTNPELIRQAGEKKLCNVALIKMNQIGTITETISAVKEARQQGMKVMASHRSGETEDAFLAHLSVGIDADYLKAGSLCRSERVCKYNELIRIFEKCKIDTI
ncbi:enolase [Nematocida major]|uniref:enolase n=1 Tax=Nematocida major TaxID=1912982 RepID=UPI002008C348|nr:enolase [Nematocida major]KAH9386246.1 enolase [Nematocida major]